MYQIESRSDFKTGATLIVKLPEDEVDMTALKTILADRPDFIIPFRHRTIDSMIEITYQLEKRSKLAYMAAPRKPNDYAQLWYDILRPLIDCPDWFMDPFAFVLQFDYLYCDKDGRNISYVYIPSKKPHSDDSMLRSFVVEIAKQNHATDINLDNKVAWALQDFNPVEFMDMLKPYMTGGTTASFTAADAPGAVSTPVSEPHPAPVAAPVPHVAPAPAAPVPHVAPAPAAPALQGDIVINLSGSGKKDDKNKKEKPAKADKVKSEPKEKIGFFGKKKVKEEIIQGAAAQTPILATPQPGVYNSSQNDDDKTEVLGFNSGTPRLRYIGHGDHPPLIDVDINISEIFSIGRFDVSAKVKQSSFEFHQKTKAVSRKHALIERKADGYYLVDLGSSAGTFLNTQQLPQNAGFKIENGSRIAFGNMGADYVWEE